MIRSPGAIRWVDVRSWGEVQDMIPGEFASMNASYEYGIFPATSSQRECLSCKFAEVCPEAAVVRR